MNRAHPSFRCGHAYTRIVNASEGLTDLHRLVYLEHYRLYNRGAGRGALISAAALGRRLARSGRRVEDVRRELVHWSLLTKLDSGPGKVAEWLITLPAVAQPRTRTLTEDEVAALAARLTEYIARRRTPTAPEVAVRGGSVPDAAYSSPPVTNPGAVVVPRGSSSGGLATERLGLRVRTGVRDNTESGSPGTDARIEPGVGEVSDAARRDWLPLSLDEPDPDQVARDAMRDGA